MPGFWAVGAGLLALAVALCVVPTRIFGRESGWSALGWALGLVLGVLALGSLVGPYLVGSSCCG